MSFDGVLAIRREKVDELAALRHRKAGADADMLEISGIIIQSEQQRSDGGLPAVLVPSKAGDDTVRVTLVLHLEHDTLVGLVPDALVFGDDTVETRALEAREPIGRFGAVTRCRCDVQRCLDLRQQLLERGASRVERSIAQISLAVRETVEEHDRRWNLLRQ